MNILLKKLYEGGLVPTITTTIHMDGDTPYDIDVHSAYDESEDGYRTFASQWSDEDDERVVVMSIDEVIDALDVIDAHSQLINEVFDALIAEAIEIRESEREETVANLNALLSLTVEDDAA